MAITRCHPRFHCRIVRMLAAFTVPLLVLFPSASMAADQRIRFQVACSLDTVLAEVRIELLRLGEERTITLVDDGTVEYDMPWDGVWVGEDVGPYARYVNVTILARRAGGDQEIIYSGLVRTPDEREVDLGWRIVGGAEGPLGAHQAAVAYPGNRMAAAEGLYVISGFGWALIIFFYVSFVVRTHRQGNRR